MAEAATEPMHLVLADAHHAILDEARGVCRHRDRRTAVGLIDEVVARLSEARDAVERGDHEAASRLFDARVGAA